jgi:hypothetical protein
MLNQISNNSKGLPFRVKAFRLTPETIDKLLDQLATASWLINGDFRLEWEDRDIAGRALVDAIYTLHEIRKSAEVQI